MEPPWSRPAKRWSASPAAAMCRSSTLCIAIRKSPARWSDARRRAGHPPVRPARLRPLRRPHAPGLPSDHRFRRHSGGRPVVGQAGAGMREKTERPEAVEAGTVKLVGTAAERIVAETELLLDNRDEFDRMSRAHNPYGDGHASERIGDALTRPLLITRQSRAKRVPASESPRAQRLRSPTPPRPLHRALRFDRPSPHAARAAGNFGTSSLQFVSLGVATVNIGPPEPECYHCHNDRPCSAKRFWPSFVKGLSGSRHPILQGRRGRSGPGGAHAPA